MSARKSKGKVGRLNARELVDGEEADGNSDSNTVAVPTVLFPPPPSPVPSPSPSPSPSPVPPSSADVFEIEDWSCATSYERFIRSLEERCREWGLDRGGNGRLSGESCELSFNERSFRLRYFSSQPDRPATEAALYLPGRGGEEEEEQEGLWTWLGLRSFLLLAPSAARKVSRHEAGLLLSALSLASAAAQCCFPLLVKVGEPRKRELWGRSSTGSRAHPTLSLSQRLPPLS